MDLDVLHFELKFLLKEGPFLTEHLEPSFLGIGEPLVFVSGEGRAGFGSESRRNPQQDSVHHLALWGLSHRQHHVSLTDVLSLFVC